MIDSRIIELKYFCYLPHFLPVHRLDFLWLRLPFWPIKATRFVGHDRSGAANWLYLPDTHLAEFALMQHHQLFAVYVVVCGFCFSIFLSLPQTNNWPDLIYHPRRFFPFVFGPLLPTPPFRSSTFGSLEVFFLALQLEKWTMDNGNCKTCSAHLAHDSLGFLGLLLWLWSGKVSPRNAPYFRLPLGSQHLSKCWQASRRFFLAIIL